MSQDSSNDRSHLQKKLHGDLEYFQMCQTTFKTRFNTSTLDPSIGDDSVEDRVEVLILHQGLVCLLAFLPRAQGSEVLTRLGAAIRVQLGIIQRTKCHGDIYGIYTQQQVCFSAKTQSVAPWSYDTNHCQFWIFTAEVLTCLGAAIHVQLRIIPRTKCHGDIYGIYTTQVNFSSRTLTFHPEHCLWLLGAMTLIIANSQYSQQCETIFSLAVLYQNLYG